jgi:hypothetical protein
VAQRARGFQEAVGARPLYFGKQTGLTIDPLNPYKKWRKVISTAKQALLVFRKDLKNHNNKTEQESCFAKKWGEQYFVKEKLKFQKNKKSTKLKKPTNKFVTTYLKESINTLNSLGHSSIEKTAKVLATVRRQGERLFICGSGGGAGHASHTVNDFRKLAGIESYCPSDNVSELTA